MTPLEYCLLKGENPIFGIWLWHRDEIEAKERVFGIRPTTLVRYHNQQMTVPPSSRRIGSFNHLGALDGAEPVSAFLSELPAEGTHSGIKSIRGMHKLYLSDPEERTYVQNSNASWILEPADIVQMILLGDPMGSTMAGGAPTGETAAIVETMPGRPYFCPPYVPLLP